MPRLPDPNELSRVAPSPSKMVTQYQPAVKENALAQFGSDVSRMAEYELAKMSDTAAQEAYTKLEQATTDLTYGDRGYKALPDGAFSQTPKGGVPVTKDYATRFKEAQDTISANLSGTAKEKFDLLAGRLSVNFQSGLLSHGLAATDRYGKVVYEQGLASRGDTVDYRNKQDINDALSFARETTQARLDSGDLVDQHLAQKQAATVIHAGVVRSALNNGDIEYAKSYLDKNGEDMDSKTLLPLREHVDALYTKRVVAINTAATLRDLQPVINPTELDRAQYVNERTESSGRQFDSKGKPLTSPAGAVGYSQIMPATGPDAAKAAGLKWDPELFNRAKTGDPVKDREAEDYNRALGRGYFEKMMNTFGGDLEKAWAAYNWGPSNVKAAVKVEMDNTAARQKNPKLEPISWKDQLPAETRKHVEKNVAAYKAGIGVTELTAQEFKQIGRTNLLQRYPQATTEQIAASDAAMEQAYTDWKQQKNQEAERTFNDIQRRFDAGEIKSKYDLLPSDRTALGPKRDAMEKYLDAEVETKLHGSSVSEDYMEHLKLNPKELIKTPVAKLYAMAPDLGKARVDDLINTRYEYLKNPEKLRTADINAETFYAITRGLGIMGDTPQSKVQLAALHNRVDQLIRDSDKQLTPGDVRLLITNAALDMLHGEDKPQR